jgi:hypothetical protein
LFKDIYPAGASAAFLFVPKYKLSRKAKQQAGWRVMNRILPVAILVPGEFFNFPGEPYVAGILTSITAGKKEYIKEKPADSCQLFSNDYGSSV